MDNAPEGRRWATLLRAANLLDRAWQESRASVGVVLLVALFYMLVGGTTDLLLSALFLAYSNKNALLEIIQSATQYIPVSRFAFINAVVAHFAIIALTAGKNAWHRAPQPYLIPSRTTHTRLFPQKHSFSYSYLAVGVPVGYKGSMNGLVKTNMWPSTGGFRWLLRPFFWHWFSVNAVDHLERGRPELDLRAKLDRYLQSEDTDPADFPHAYLVTAPRFAGYNFNPVSFWFLYSKEKVLSGIISEVNNTFDERRSYLSLRDFEAEKDSSSAPAEGPRVKALINKDFHVSPFNSRKGTYTILARDPLGHDMNGFHGLDVTITLKSSKGHSKLVARLFSDGPATDPLNLGLLGKQAFIAKWFWVGFATFPRIVKEAAALFYRRKLHVWYRPEPLSSTMGRHATSREAKMEACFRRYLQCVVSQSKDSVSVKYIPAGLADSGEFIFRSPTACESKPGEVLELRVLTSVFYIRFLHYSDSFLAIDSELKRGRTVWIDAPESWAKLFAIQPTKRITVRLLDQVCLQVIKGCRRQPWPIPESSTSAGPVERPEVDGKGNFRTSPMDLYMAACEDKQLKNAYLRIAMRRLVAKQYFAGYGVILDLGLLLFRIGVAFIFTSALMQVVEVAHVTI